MCRIYTYMAVFYFATACGSHNKKEKPLVDPGPQELYVGKQSTYVLDPTRSDNLLDKGELTVTVTEITTEHTSFNISGQVHALLKDVDFHLDRNVPNEVLNWEFMEELRENGTYERSDEFKLSYLGIDGQCDILEVYDIKDYDWMRINFNLCLNTRNVPEVRAVFKLFGSTVHATFLLKD